MEELKNRDKLASFLVAQAKKRLLCIMLLAENMKTSACIGGGASSWIVRRKEKN